MGGELLKVQDTSIATTQNSKQFVTIEVGGQMFGIPVLIVQDVLRPQRITRAPLAPSVILGSINLRGRIVTVISVRERLGLPPREDNESYMLVVVHFQNELYSLVVDKVGDVLSLPLKDFEPTPSNLSSQWREVSAGVYRLEKKLMVALDIETLLTLQ